MKKPESENQKTLNELPQDATVQVKGAKTSHGNEDLDFEIVEKAAGETVPTIEGYKIKSQIGRGAMGVVYRATQESVGREVAIKTVSGWQTESNRERFRIEAEAVARLQHANIIQLYDYGELEDRQYFSLELVEGGTLREILDENPPSVRQAAEWIETLARAIHFAHERNVVHRDLKPANVLVTSEGELKISDFGLAKRTDNDQSQTQAGDIMGTPYYMSPEQAEGISGNIGPATDIYSLGAVLYDMVVGQPPFEGDTVMETLDKIRHQEPPPLRSQNPKVHIDLETICLKCLQKEPRYRYQTALEFADDLRRFLDGEPVVARPIGRLEKLKRTALRYPMATGLGVALVLSGLILVAIIGYSSNRISKSDSIAEETAKQAREKEAELEAKLDADRAIVLDIPNGLKSIPIPADNPLTAAKVELGKKLFFDKRLSADNSVSCASCHDPEQGWGDGDAVATGVGGKTGNRNSPSIVNTAHQRMYFWDGRAESYEEQAFGPLTSPIEMGNTDPDAVAKKIGNILEYQLLFAEAFEDGLTAVNISKSLAAFQRTILSGNSPYDQFKSGDELALSESAQRGMKLFFNKANCSACHGGAYFSDGGFHNIGLPVDDADNADVGRETVSGMLGDRRSFKTPSLRDVARTAPYMHDGSIATLEKVVEHYDRGGDGNPQQDEEIFPLNLTEEQKKDLVAFLREGLSGPDYPTAAVED